MKGSTLMLNLVVYLLVGSTSSRNGKVKPKFFMGGHGYTYDVAVEGKKKLAKDVPTSTGYYTGNKQKPNTVVTVEDILSLVVANGHSEQEVLYKGLQALLAELSKPDSTYKNVCIIAPYRDLERLIKPSKLDLEDPLFKETSELVASFTANKQRLVMVDLPGAAEGGLGNRLAHKQMELAEVETIWGGRKELAISLELTPRKEYENPETDFNKIVTATRWYFETNNREKFYETKHGYRIYGFGKVEPDKNYYGKLTPDVTYSKLYTKKPIQLLDKLFEFTVGRINNPNGYLTAGELNNLTSKDVARLLNTIPAIPEKGNLVSPITKGNGKPILIELISPTMMSYRVREFLDVMDFQVEAFLQRDENNKFGHVTFYDITDEIYVKEENKKGEVKLKINPNFTQTTSVIKVNVNHPKAVKPVPIMLSVGYDLPTRNAFNSVTDATVKVWVIANTQNDMGVRYASLVETGEFLYLHTAAASNLRVLTVAELPK